MSGRRTKVAYIRASGLSDAIRQAVAISGVSGNQLAKETGIGQGVISRFLRGKDITLRRAEKIAARFQLRLVAQSEIRGVVVEGAAR